MPLPNHNCYIHRMEVLEFQGEVFLLKPEPLEPPPNEAPSIPIELLRRSRKQFSEQLLEKMRAPDGGYDESFVAPGLMIPRRKAHLTAIDLEMNNPLSLHDENPWKAWFAAVDLRKTIQQDVERTFPDMGYFRNEDIQHQLTNVLFLYCAMHPNIGYRQGMHELLAPLFYAIDFDSVTESESSELDPLFSEICSRSWVAADSWALFSSLMRSISHWYEWQEPVAPPSISRGQINLKPYVSPIIHTCNNIQGPLLKSVDPVLHDAMRSAGVEPQMYGLRWLRLLFTREFPMNEAMMLWDGLFASSSPISDIMQWMCVAMLIRIRTKLISADYSVQLMHLLRYPPCPGQEEGAPHHILLLIRQATALEILHTPTAGASLAIENRNFLNVPLEVQEPPVIVRRRARPAERAYQPTSSEYIPGSPPAESLRQQPSFPEIIARGLLDRGESLGINKTVMNAVSELKRNLPDLASTLVRPPSFGSPSSSYPLLDERTPSEKDILDQRREMGSARELAELRQQNKRLGEAVTWILETLNRDVDRQDEQETTQMKQSLQSLSYVRDVLSGQINEVDERRLWGEEEFKRRWETRETSLSIAWGGSGSPRESRRFTPNTAIPPSVNETLRGFISSKVSPAPDHNRSASAGTPVASRATLPPRAPVRVSGNNPFQRVSEGGNVRHAQWSSGATRAVISGDSGSSDMRNQVSTQHDPLGVLR
ncbi:hypothetical protein JVU11DRAFT_862 [Chiua virens]|nr:hypothetical protein JVU11DRAFT_862 [Chiua virens]